MNRRCRWPPDSLLARALRLLAQPPGLEQLVPVGRPAVEGGVQVERLPHLDLVLQVGFLQLHAHPLAQCVPVGLRVQPEHPDAPRVGPPQAGHALYGGGLASAVRAEDAEDFAPLDGE